MIPTMPAATASWWRDQEVRWLSGQPTHPMAWRVLEHRHGPQPKGPTHGNR